MLRDLSIQNYRTFKDFNIDGLTRVNLIVGMNNCGKTSLMEAVYLLVNQVNLECLIDLLHNRGEIADPSISIIPGETRQLSNSYQVRHIFHEHQLKLDQPISFQSQNEQPLSLQIYIDSHPIPTSIPPEWQQFLFSQGIGTGRSRFLLAFSDQQNSKMVIPIRDDGLIEAHSFQFWKDYSPNPFLPTNNKSLFLTTSKLSCEQLAVFWDGITLTPKEECIVQALQILEPDVERISFTSRQTPNSGILIKMRGDRDPIPLASMGEGMHRILTLAMAAVTVENGVLLVDEIETGLYYQAQTDMWRLLLEIAQRLNVQVFATTHSWDCICAFQEVLAQSKDSSVGKLFRLSWWEETIRAIGYSAEKLAVAVSQNIEVR